MGWFQSLPLLKRLNVVYCFAGWKWTSCLIQNCRDLAVLIVCGYKNIELARMVFSRHWNYKHNIYNKTGCCKGIAGNVYFCGIMLTEDEKKFIAYWEVNRLRRRKSFKQLTVGLPLAAVIVIAIFINFFSGWYKRAD